MFKRYECGCIGYVVNGMSPNGDKRVYVFKACDKGDRELSICRRDTLQQKPSEKLTDEEVESLFDELAELLQDGHALRELRDAMKVAGI